MLSCEQRESSSIRRAKRQDTNSPQAVCDKYILSLCATGCACAAAPRQLQGIAPSLAHLQVDKAGSALVATREEATFREIVCHHSAKRACSSPPRPTLAVSHIASLIRPHPSRHSSQRIRISPPSMRHCVLSNIGSVMDVPLHLETCDTGAPELKRWTFNSSPNHLVRVASFCRHHLVRRNPARVMH
jgi:hypothetical protein